MSGRIDFGRRIRVLRFGPGRRSVLLDLRLAAVCAALLGLAALVAVLALGTGTFVLSVPEVLATFVGEGPRTAQVIVLDWRMPRVLAALLFGAALGLSGAIFQSLTRNPLGSPDVIGFSTGSYTGALIVIIVGGGAAGGYAPVAAGALLGGMVTAAVVYLLAYNHGLQGFRLIIVGIGVSALLGSVNTWLLLTAQLEVAMSAALWGAGSLNGLGWAQTVPAALVLAVLVPLAFAFGRPMRQLELGDDSASALGVPVGRTRLLLIVIGVALQATVTAAAGPIAFIALAAPQIARRLAPSTGLSLAGSAAMGALLLVFADWLAQRLFAPNQLPVGIVTVGVGGLYLVWLLVRESRKR